MIVESLENQGTNSLIAYNCSLVMPYAVIPPQTASGGIAAIVNPQPNNLSIPICLNIGFFMSALAAITMLVFVLICSAVHDTKFPKGDLLLACTISLT